MGHIVTSNGFVVGPKGLKKPILKMVRKKDKDGNSYMTGDIDKHEISIIYNDRKTYRSFGRFIYAAFNEDFDIDNHEVIVVSDSPYRFERNVYKLKVMTRSDRARTTIAEKLFYDDEREVIYKTYEQAKGHLTIQEFADKIGCSKSYLEGLLEEYRREENNSTNSKRT